ncbi:MAG: hypothetical protein MJH10_06595 [Epibacterium sp.]|nr:hypothetical protein [Epibacterium sp.]NQX73212.1 hypothetical protein [Epibacterium sp.]
MRQSPQKGGFGASNAALSRELGFTIEAVAKWRKRAAVSDAAMGLEDVHAAVFSNTAEAAIATFRRHSLMPLDHCRCAL